MRSGGGHLDVDMTAKDDRAVENVYFREAQLGRYIVKIRKAINHPCIVSNVVFVLTCDVWAGNFSGPSPKEFEVSLITRVPVRLRPGTSNARDIPATEENEWVEKFRGSCTGDGASSDEVVVEFEVLVDLLEDEVDSEEEPDEDDDGFDADICYCLQSHVKLYYMENAQKRADERQAGLESTALIVDEVDDLVIDKEPTVNYLKKEVENGRKILECFRSLERARGKPDRCPDRIWTMAREARAKAKEWKEGTEYRAISTDGVEGYTLLNSRGQDDGDYSLELEYLKYKNFRRRPQYKSQYFTTCVPHIFNQYRCIFGLTGSIGGDAERKYLREHYCATFVDVPSFMSTCDGAPDHVPECLEVSVESGEDQQVDRVIKLAREHAKDVPVVIITESPVRVRNIHSKLQHKDHSQTLLEADEHGKKLSDEWEDVIRDSTKRVADKSQYRITVTDYFGGRGIDYPVGRSEDAEEIDARGGLMLIMTNIPDNGREWIQWIGRTARQDQKGQYAVVLSRQEDFITKCIGNGRHACTSEIKTLLSSRQTEKEKAKKVIDALLEKRNDGMAEMLSDFEDSVQQGSRLNELCDDFYRTFGEIKDWPGQEHSAGEKLAAFFREKDFTIEAVNRFRTDVDGHRGLRAADQDASRHVNPPSSSDDEADDANDAGPQHAGAADGLELQSEPEPAGDTTAEPAVDPTGVTEWHETTVVHLQSEISELKASQAAASRAAEESHAAALWAAEESHAAALRAAEESHAAALRAAESELDTATESLRSEPANAATLSGAAREAEAARDAERRQMAQLHDATVANLQSEIYELKAALQALRRAEGLHGNDIERRPTSIQFYESQFMEGSDDEADVRDDTSLSVDPEGTREGSRVPYVMLPVSTEALQEDAEGRGDYQIATARANGAGATNGDVDDAAMDEPAAEPAAEAGDGEDEFEEHAEQSEIVRTLSSLQTPTPTFESEQAQSVRIQAPDLAEEPTRVELPRGLENTTLEELKGLFIWQIQSSLATDQLVVRVKDKVLEAVHGRVPLALVGVSDGATLHISQQTDTQSVREDTLPKPGDTGHMEPDSELQIGSLKRTSTKAQVEAIDRTIASFSYQLARTRTPNTQAMLDEFEEREQHLAQDLMSEADEESHVDKLGAVETTRVTPRAAADAPASMPKATRPRNRVNTGPLQADLGVQDDDEFEIEANIVEAATTTTATAFDEDEDHILADLAAMMDGSDDDDDDDDDIDDMAAQLAAMDEPEPELAFTVQLEPHDTLAPDGGNLPIHSWLSDAPALAAELGRQLRLHDVRFEAWDERFEEWCLSEWFLDEATVSGCLRVRLTGGELEPQPEPEPEPVLEYV